jgi:VIT1/CCC1 family predicted Fe2+/Mn2+ transporter
MSEAERTRERESDTAAGTADTAASEDQTTDSGGKLFSLRALVVAFVAIGAGMTLGSLVPVIPFTAIAGIPLGAFLHGLLDSQRRYAETAVAGGLLASLAVVTSLLPQLVAGLNGTRLFAVAAVVGAVLALVGHYFGRDLRAGLTRELRG